MLRTILAPLLLLVLAAASAGAVLLVHEVERGGSPIGQPTVTRWFSPDGDGRVDVAVLRMRLDEPDRVSVVVEDEDGERVRVLARERASRGKLVLRWDGEDERGRRVPEGRYSVDIELHELGRSFDLQSPVVVDVTPPQIGALKLDITRVTTQGAVRALATGVKDSEDYCDGTSTPADPTSRAGQCRFLTLDGTPLKTRRGGRVVRDEAERKANSYERFIISAQLPGSALADARRVRLVVVDRAGNRAERAGTVLDGAVRIPDRGDGGGS